MARFRIKKRVPRKVLKARLQQLENFVIGLAQKQQRAKDPGQVIVAPTEREIAQVTMGVKQ